MQKIRKIFRAVSEKTALPTNQPNNYYQQHRSYRTSLTPVQSNKVLDLIHFELNSKALYCSFIIKVDCIYVLKNIELHKKYKKHGALNWSYFLIPSSTENNFVYLSIRQGIKHKFICSGVVSVYSSIALVICSTLLIK